MVLASLVIGWFVVAILVCVHLLGRKQTVAISMLVAVLIPVSFTEVRFRLNQQRLSEVASRIVGSPVRVHCQRLGANLVDTTTVLGYVPYRFDGARPTDAYLRRETCGDLFDFVSDPNRPDPARSLAVHVLTHESMHLRGEADEARAECQARQRDARTARLLGAGDDAARNLVEVYTRTGLPRLPDAYRTEQCVDGGVLDEDLPDPPWFEVALP